MALQADVQKLVDEVAENKSLAKSAIAGNALMSSQIADLNAKIDGLKAGSVLTVEDLEAVKAAGLAVDETNTELKGAVPANTPPEALPPPEQPPLVEPTPPSA